MTTPPPPPENIALFVEVLGLDDTLLLLEAKGGTRLWVPKGVDNSSMKLKSDLEAEFGVPMVKALIRTFGGGRIEVPLCGEWRTALYASRGLTQEAIARKLGCHYKTVTRRMQRARIENRQTGWAF
jgi:hypothetical protein